MPVKLKSESPEFSHAIEGGPITRAQVKSMVNTYRSNRKSDPSALNFVHFSAVEILNLFAANKVISALTPDQQTQAKPYGMKVYMANHGTDSTTIPTGQTSYLNHDTVVICNTNLTNNVWDDMLTPGVNSVTLVSYGDGEDKGSICPPDCPPNPDPAGNIQDDIEYDN